MRLSRFVLVALAGCTSLAFSQSFEASVSGGESYIPSKDSDIGSVDGISPSYHLRDGFKIALRMTLNQWRFMGHEFGYGYNHTSLDSPASTVTTATGTVVVAAQNTGLPAHQGFYDFLVYATPEGSHVRPFACGGVQFTSFSPPNSYNRETKYGVNFGGGLKIRIRENWGFRLDAREYNMSKPFNLVGASGRLRLYEFAIGISFMM